MRDVIDWLLDPWTSAVVQRGALMAMLAGIPAAAVGCWVIMRDLPYAAESLAHGMFPGILAALWLGLPVVVGGLLGLFLVACAMVFARRSGVDPDSAVAVAVTPLLGAGALLAGATQLASSVNAALFGDLLGATNGDILLTAVIAVGTGLALHSSHWRLVSAGLRGRSHGVADLIVIALLAAVILAAARSLGALLAVALVIGPAAAARELCRRATPMLLVASAIATGSVALGMEVSWHLDLPTGPVIALCAIIPSAIIATATRFGGRSGRTPRHAKGI